MKLEIAIPSHIVALCVSSMYCMQAGDALLHWAAWYGNSNMISMLIEEFKASPNVKNQVSEVYAKVSLDCFVQVAFYDKILQGGQTPIQYAAMMGKRELVMLLAGKYKADVNVQSRAVSALPSGILCFCRNTQAFGVRLF